MAINAYKPIVILIGNIYIPITIKLPCRCIKTDFSISAQYICS